MGPSRESQARAEARKQKFTPKNLDRVELWINKRNNLVFQGKDYATSDIITLCLVDAILT